MKLLYVKRAFPNTERREEKLGRTLARCLQALVAICVTVSAVHVTSSWFSAPANAAKNSGGTLSATLVVHPKSMKDKRIADAVENAIIKLRYGTVGVNAWPGMSFGFCTPPWGAYPGSTQKDIQSGSGFVHNTPMLEGIEKAVLRYPLTTFPKPAYFPSHRSTDALMQRMTALEERQAFSKVPGVLAAAMRG